MNGLYLTHRAWRSLFHLDEEIVHEIYSKYCQENNISKEELYIGLHFLVCYLPEDISHCLFNIGKNRYRFILKKIIDTLYKILNEISLEDRWLGVETSGLFAGVS